MSHRVPPSGKQVARLARDTDTADVELYRYEIQAWVDGEKDRVDSQVLGEVTRAAIEEDGKTYDHLMRVAGNSRVLIEIGLRKLNNQATAEDRRIMRRFGR